MGEFQKKMTSSSVLASFATLKSLSDDKKYKSPYQILREFIRYIVSENSLYTFSAIEMKHRLYEQFCFTIPEAVIRTALKGMDGVSLESGIYHVSMGEMGKTSLFSEKKKEADTYETSIIRLLSDYIASRNENIVVNEELLTQELTSFLVEDFSAHSSHYTDYIGEFVLKYEHDDKIQAGLNQIREGSILYMGLSHSIGEIGSITKTLTLYLGTEVLFSLVGYNGEIFQQFANDFYEQVRMANSGKTKKIVLHYFADIRKEIDDFFATAGEIVEGKRSYLLDKPAMKAITDGCSTSSDVDVKKSDFYYRLQYSYGITEDPNDGYYDEQYFSSNLESFDYEDEADKNKKKELALKLISHINKLRHGSRSHSDVDSEYLIVTNTKVTLLIAKEQVDNIKASEGLDDLCNFAVSLDRITSLLWYKLGNGFAKKKFPSSVNAALRARVVLSSSIAKNADREFSKIKAQFKDGLITEDQVAARIITLRKKPNLPEDLQSDDITEVMDFSSDYLSRYEEQYKSSQTSIKEKDEVIKTLKDDAEKERLQKDATIASQQAENLELREQIQEYQQKEAAEQRKKERRKNRFKFIWSIVWKLLVIACLTAMVMFLQKKYNFTIPPLAYTIVDVLALVVAFQNDVREAWRKYLKK